MMYNHDSEPLQIETAEESNLTYKEVWETLSKIDVSPYFVHPFSLCQPPRHLNLDQLGRRGRQ